MDRPISPSPTTPRGALSRTVGTCNGSPMATISRRSILQSSTPNGSPTGPRSSSSGRTSRGAARTSRTPRRPTARRWAGRLPAGWDAALPVFGPKDAQATRAASGKVLNALAATLPELIGGSADLTGSNNTEIKGAGPERNFHYGVREHAMGAVLNGITLHRGFIPFGGTFLIFSDYMRPSIRLAALTHLRPIYVFTHDSIGLGEDGPTHQPIEQLSALRAIPNMTVIRPSDPTEVVEAWRAAIKHQNGPVALVLTRQKVAVVDRTKYAPAAGLHKGGYVLADSRDPDVVLMATGSEVELILGAYENQLDFRTCRHEHHVGISRVCQDIAAFMQPCGGRVLRAVHDGHFLSCQDKRHRAVLVLDRRPPRLDDLRWIGRSEHRHVGNGAQRGELLDRLVCRPVFAQPDRIMREDVDRPEMRQRGQPNRWPHVVGEDQEGAAKRNESAMQRNAVQHRAHGVLADSIMEIPLRPGPFDLGVVRARQVG